jgi:hypothetical protein
MVALVVAKNVLAVIDVEMEAGHETPAHVLNG